MCGSAGVAVFNFSQHDTDYSAIEIFQPKLKIYNQVTDFVCRCSGSFGSCSVPKFQVFGCLCWR